MELCGSLYHQRTHTREVFGKPRSKPSIVIVVGDTILFYEDFSTVVLSIESISRPLTALSDVSADHSSLTPGHFLIGSTLSAYFYHDLTSVSGNRLSNRQKCFKMQQ